MSLRNPIPRFAAALALAALLALPFATPAVAGPQDEGATAQEDSRVHVVRVPGGEIHRQVEVITVDEEGVVTGDGEEKKQIRVVVAAPGDGEDGEPRRFVWRGESREGGDMVWTDEEGQVIELEGMPGNAFFTPGVARGFLGVELTELSSDLRLHFGAREDRGVLIARVVPDSPAERAGLRVGDVLTHVDGEAVSGSFDVTRRIGGRSAGEVAALEVIRDGKVETLSATLEERERPQVEVRKLLGRLGEGDEHVYHFDSGELEEQMEGVRAYFESPEWKQAMSEMGDELRRKLESLEIELDGLEQRLEIELDEEVDVDPDFDVELDPGVDPNP